MRKPIVISKDWCLAAARAEEGYCVAAGLLALDPTMPEQGHTFEQQKPNSRPSIGGVPPGK